MLLLSGQEATSSIYAPGGTAGLLPESTHPDGLPRPMLGHADHPHCRSIHLSCRSALRSAAKCSISLGQRVDEVNEASNDSYNSLYRTLFQPSCATMTQANVSQQAFCQAASGTSKQACSVNVKRRCCSKRRKRLQRNLLGAQCCAQSGTLHHFGCTYNQKISPCCSTTDDA